MGTERERERKLQRGDNELTYFQELVAPVTDAERRFEDALI